jgi:thymidylate synthase
MRIYADCYELISEIQREVYEMGAIVKPNSMQNKIIKGNDDYITKEIINYSYCLQTRDKEDYLFLADPTSKEWVRAEFGERIDPSGEINPGEAYKLRKDLWEQFMVKGKQDYSYNERMMPSVALQNIVCELRANPDSRQLVLSIWDRKEDTWGIGGHKRVPCSVYYQFLYRQGRLHIIYNQRSADVVTHFGNDVWLAWELMRFVAKETRLEPGFLYHNIASLHSYKKDWVTLKTCIDEIRPRY